MVVTGFCFCYFVGIVRCGEKNFFREECSYTGSLFEYFFLLSSFFTGDPSNESGLYHKLKKALMGAVGLEEIALKGNKMQIRYAERMDCLLKCLYLSIN